MNLGELIVLALEPIGLPIEPSTYTGTDDTYLIYYFDEVPVLFADDHPQHMRYLVEIYLIAPAGRGLSQYRNNIRKQLVKNGFTYPNVGHDSVLYRSTEGQQTLLFKCEYTAPIEAGSDGND